uniref:CPBP family intramembrane glutamic endopeptidase n=1 Tax=Lentilactobacillus parafarraginis TaxID=390842 RepID=UPI00384E1993
MLMAFSAGMCEEFIFRGLLLSACLEIFSRSNLKYTLTACLSALFFGMFHFVNALHQPIGATIQQVIYACVLGMLLAAVRISTNTMGWVVLLHWLYDASAGLSVNTSATGTGLWAPFLIFWGLLLLVALLFMISYDHSTNRISLSRDYISRS